MFWYFSFFTLKNNLSPKTIQYIIPDITDCELSFGYQPGIFDLRLMT